MYDKERKWKRILKGISREDFPDNCVERLSSSSFWMRTNDCFKRLSNKFASEGSPIYLPNLGSKFSRTKSFCFENNVLLTFGLGIREGVSEGSRHRNGWVTFSSMRHRNLSRNLHVLLKCVERPLHVHLGGE